MRADRDSVQRGDAPLNLGTPACLKLAQTRTLKMSITQGDGNNQRLRRSALALMPRARPLKAFATAHHIFIDIIA